MDIAVGRFNTLRVDRRTEFGYYLDDGERGILLPKKVAPPNLKKGDEISVFLYHDSDDRLIATTEIPKAQAGETALLKVVGVTKQGAFLDWGLLKDLFVPVSKQISGMRLGGEYLVQLYIDERTGRIAATEKLDALLSNDSLTVKEMQAVDLVAYRPSELGWVMIVNNRHTGLLHANEIFTTLQVGQQCTGFVKRVRPDGKLDLVLGKAGFEKTTSGGGDAEKILQLLSQNGGFLPYHDKSDPQDIYAFFGMSKKAFKMALGHLYKQKKVSLAENGCRLLES
ncbi:MAG: RNA-binding protein [Sphingobacteriia bacterium]|nr:MAG: RNA-binding protein [Sphingobacteriia bacterium]